MDAYHDDLAYIHDVGYGNFAQNAAPGLLDILRQYGVTTGRVIDLGCGSGLWARELVKAGYAVLGIDLSASMIALARQRVPQGDFTTGSFLEVDFPPCDAVTSLGECFNYLFDQRQSLHALRQLFRRIYTALRPGGVLVFDIAEPGRGRSPSTRQQKSVCSLSAASPITLAESTDESFAVRSTSQRHREGVDWAIMVTYEEDTARHQLTRRITTFRKINGSYRRGHEVHRLQLYRGAEMAQELRRVGFRVRIVRGYGPLRFPKCYVGFMARKAL